MLEACLQHNFNIRFHKNKAWFAWLHQSWGLLPNNQCCKGKAISITLQWKHVLINRDYLFFVGSGWLLFDKNHKPTHNQAYIVCVIGTKIMSLTLQTFIWTPMVKSSKPHPMNSINVPLKSQPTSFTLKMLISW